ncbi:hypothetical protein [Amycolatopsis minnesotensis]
MGTLVDEHGTPVPEIAPISAGGARLDAGTTHARKAAPRSLHNGH